MSDIIGSAKFCCLLISGQMSKQTIAQRVSNERDLLFTKLLVSYFKGLFFFLNYASVGSSRPGYEWCMIPCGRYSRASNVLKMLTTAYYTYAYARSLISAKNLKYSRHRWTNEISWENWAIRTTNKSAPIQAPGTHFEYFFQSCIRT